MFDIRRRDVIALRRRGGVAAPGAGAAAGDAGDRRPVRAAAPFGRRPLLLDGGLVLLRCHRAPLARRRLPLLSRAAPFGRRPLLLDGGLLALLWRHRAALARRLLLALRVATAALRRRPLRV